MIVYWTQFVEKPVDLSNGKNSEENLEKDSPYVYLCSLGMRVFMVLVLR